MEKYKKTLIHCAVGMAVLCIMLIVMYILFSSSILSPYLPLLPETARRDMHDALRGMVVGYIGTFGYLIFYNLRSAKNPEKLEKRYIRDNDERERLIEEKTASGTLIITAYCLIFALVIAGSMSVIVFYTLAVVLVCISFIWIGSFIYYKHKY